MNSCTFNVRRVDDEKQYRHGYRVVIWMNAEYVHSKIFSDKKCGGKRKAKIMAEQYAEACRKKAPKEYRNKVKQAQRYGMALKDRGVKFYSRDRGHRVDEFWIGQYCDANGNVRRKQFSIRKYGKRNAKQLAQAFRDKGIAVKVIR